MQNRPERDLRNSPIFCNDDKRLWDIRENMPWPAECDTLLGARVGVEETIHYPFFWDSSVGLDQLDLFANQYRTCARDLIPNWLASRSGPGQLLYVVGFLYRHAVELGLKAIITRSDEFRKALPDDQRRLLHGHSLQGLWNRVKPHLQLFMSANEIATPERLILELHELDARSDGFRYPFAFDGKTATRITLLDGLYNSSFDNFVWILDGLTSWLATTADMEEHYRQFHVEQAGF